MAKQLIRAPDPEMAEFEEALLRSVEQAVRGEGRVTTPEQIAARRERPVAAGVPPAPFKPTA